MKATASLLRSFLAGMAVVAFASRAVAGNPDVTFYLVAKGQHFMQTNDAAPVLDTSRGAYRFISQAEPGSPGTILSATLRRPNNSTILMTNEPGENQFGIESSYATKSALDSAFPSNNYVVTIQTQNSGTQTATLRLFPDHYPTNAPRVINWVELQGAEVSNVIRIDWEPFIDGTTNDFVELFIEDESGNEVFSSGGTGEEGALDGTSTFAEIAANTLGAGSNYHATLLFARISPPNLTDISGATGISAYYKETRFSIVGATPPPPGGRFRFSASSYSVSEGAGGIIVTVQRAGGTAGPAFVVLSTRAGTASPGDDYQEINPSIPLFWPDGDGNSQDVPVAPGILIAEDSLLEGNETFFVTLSQPGGEGQPELGLPSEATVTILDNEISGAGILQFSAPMFMGVEATTNVALTVTRTGGAVGTVQVFYNILPGSAVAPDDFTAVSGGTLVFSNGVTSRTINIPIVADQLDETNETFTVRLDSPTGGAALGANSIASVVIKDDDTAGTLSFSASMYSVSESTNATRASVIVRRAGGAADAVSVDLVVTGVADHNAILDEDYTHAGGDTVTLQFGPGQLAVTNVFDILVDQEPEGDEFIGLQLRYPSGGAILRGITNSVIKILDDEVVFQFSKDYYTNKENAAVAIVFVERTGPTTGSNSVRVGTVVGDATPGADYLSTNQLLSFPRGVKRKPVGIRLINDYLVETPETIGLILEDPTDGAQVVPPRDRATLFILSEDAGGKIQFAASTINVLESRAAVPIVVTRTMGLASNVTVRLRTTDIFSATDGVDYAGIETNLVFGPREARKTVHIPILGDAIDESNETFQVTLDNVTGGAEIGLRSGATVVILDNDAGGIISFSRAEYLANESIGDLPAPSNSVRVIVNRAGGLASNVTVRLTTIDGSASAAQPDYDALDTVLTFAAGETSKTNLIRIRDDVQPEGAVPETVNLMLREFTGGARPGLSNATLRITDDESSVAFSTNMVMGTEGKTVTLTVLRAGALGTTATVGYRTVGGTATEGVDYRGTNGTLTFGPNVSSRTITVSLTFDSETETNESFTVSMENPSGVLLGTVTNAAVAIKDAPDPNAVPLSGGDFVRVTAVGVTNSTFSRTFNLTDGTLRSVYLQPGVGDNISIIGRRSFSSIDPLLIGDETVTLTLTAFNGPGAYYLEHNHLQVDATYRRSTNQTEDNFAWGAFDEGATGYIIIDNYNGTRISGRYSLIISEDDDDTRWVRITGSFLATLD